MSDPEKEIKSWCSLFEKRRFELLMFWDSFVFSGRFSGIAPDLGIRGPEGVVCVREVPHGVPLDPSLVARNFSIRRNSQSPKNLKSGIMGSRHPKNYRHRQMTSLTVPGTCHSLKLISNQTKLRGRAA